MAEEEILSDFDLNLALQGLEMRGDAAEMERIVNALGEQIKLTRENIDKEWKSLTEEGQILLETDVGSVKDFTQYLQDKAELGGHICSTEPMNLNVFLNNVVQALERNIGQEEKILDELASFASDQGFILPTPVTESSIVDIRQSTSSLNVVLSENEETTSALWERIRKMIGQGLLANIDTLDPCRKKYEFEILPEKVKLLEKLCILYTPNDVWKKYLNVRNQQIKRFLQNPASLDGLEVEQSYIPDENIPVEVTCLMRVSHVLDMMFEEDYNIVSLGMFPDAVHMQPEEMYNVYLKDFKDELHELVKRLQTMGRKGSGKAADNSGNTLSKTIVMALRQCVSAASSADVCAKKFLRSLQSSEEPCGMLGVDFGSSFSISSISTSQVEVNTASEVSQEISPEEVVRDEPEDLDTDEHIWSWQEEFKQVVSKLALAISESIQSETRSALQNEMQDYEKSHMTYEAVDITESLVDDTLDYPKLISKSCDVIMRKINELAPFLLLKPGKEFEALRNSYMESVTSNLMSYQSRLVQISSDVPRSSPIRNLYLAFNSAVFIQLTLRKFAENYGNIAGSLTSVYNDLVESLNEKIVSYHFSTIATVVLHDVQSHHWINHKEFFEGERCSFSVQMWNYYMQGLQHDLWMYCPPLKSQEIFTSVVQYSLACFVRRYSKALPTYRRTKLFRSDITAILFSVSSWMIFPLSTSCTDIFNPEPTRNVILDIHNSCSALLAIMTIITCPLETLCVFTTGGGEELIKEGKSTTTSWLTWLQPELYGEHCKSLLSLSDVQAVNIYFKLMINQSSAVWRLVLQTVLLRHSYLAVTIVTYLESHQIHFYNEDIANSQEKKLSVQFSPECQLSSVDDNTYYSSIVTSLYYVILKCAKDSKSLSNFVIALINRENSWQMFASTEGLRLSEEDKIPVWLDCLFSTFKPFMRRLTDLALATLRVQKQNETTSFKFTSMNSLPCGCHVNKPTTTAKPVDKIKLIFEAFEQILRTLFSTVNLLPKVILKLFNKIQDDLCQLKLTSDKTPSAGMKLLGSMLYRIFCAIGNDEYNDCKFLAEIFYHMLLGDMEGLFKTCHLPSALETMIKNKKDWIDDQVKRVGDVISKMDEEEPLAVSSQDNFHELQFYVRVRELFLDSKGEKALKEIYKFFVAKKDWIIRRIPLGSHVGSIQHPPATTRGGVNMFDPQYAYTNLGEYCFNHDAIENFPFDWEQMIQNNIGMGLKSFKRLVFNRYEFQHEKDIEEHHKDLVEKVKAFYDPETSSV